VLAGGALDLGGFTATCAVTAVSGTITNGTLYTVLSPAGTNVVGAETLALAAASLQGTYLADVTAGGASDFLTVQGSVDISGLALMIVNPAQLNPSRAYTVATFTGTRTGMFATPNLPDSRWHLSYAVDGTVRLIFVDGTVLMLK